MLVRVIALIRSKPFDTTTESGRSQERHRRIVLTAIASIAERGAGILTTLLVVPLTLRFLGDERYGLWMAITSLIGMVGFANLGLGNGLLNMIADAHGRDDPQAARRFVSNAFALLVPVALVVVIGFAVAYLF